jgi:hypothetical protein
MKAEHKRMWLIRQKRTHIFTCVYTVQYTYVRHVFLWLSVQCRLKTSMEIHLYNPHQDVIETRCEGNFFVSYVISRRGQTCYCSSACEIFCVCVCIRHYNSHHNLIVGYVRILIWRMENPTGGQVDKVAHLE